MIEDTLNAPKENYDYLHIADNFELRKLVSENDDEPLYTEQAELKIVPEFGFKKKEKLFEKKSFIICKKALYVCNEVIDEGRFKRFSREEAKRVMYDDIIKIRLLYRLETVQKSNVACKTDDFIITLVGNYYLWFRVYPKRSTELVEFLSNAIQTRLCTYINIKKKNTKTVENNILTVQKPIFSHALLKKWSIKNVVMEGFLNYNSRPNISYQFNTWKLRYAYLTTDFLVMSETKEDLEAARYIFSHKKKFVTYTLKDFPFKLDIIILSGMGIVKVNYNKKTNKTSKSAGDGSDVNYENINTKDSSCGFLIQFHGTSNKSLNLRQNSPSLVKEQSTLHYFKFSDEEEREEWISALCDRHRLNKAVTENHEAKSRNRQIVSKPPKEKLKQNRQPSRSEKAAATQTAEDPKSHPIDGFFVTTESDLSVEEMESAEAEPRTRVGEKDPELPVETTKEDETKDVSETKEKIEKFEESKDSEEIANRSSDKETKEMDDFYEIKKDLQQSSNKEKDKTEKETNADSESEKLAKKRKNRRKKKNKKN